jgi:fused signal recognition particle receptor
VARLRTGLSETRRSLLTQIDGLFTGGMATAEAWEALEELLLAADLGPSTVLELLEAVRSDKTILKGAAPGVVRDALAQGLLGRLAGAEAPLEVPEGVEPFVVLVVGVNGVGKTTTIAKLARGFQSEGRSVLLACADTFRAAASEQLEVWAERLGVDLVAGHPGADPASVAYDALEAARARGASLVLTDTAGRLHTQAPLMEELKKISRVMGKVVEGAPHEVLLVLDATTGQNATAQARLFGQALGVTGLVLTKLDGTAKGGVVVRIVEELGLPVRAIGVGEALEDLQPFRAEEFVEALFVDTS